MSAVDIIESVRPDVDPLALVERRMIREQLFGAGHGDVSRNITARSANGAVVSTAPRGTRALASTRGPARGSLTKVAAGLLLLGALGAAGWSFMNRDEATDTIETTNTTVAAAATTSTAASTTTAAPTTVAARVRTGVSDIFPIVIPAAEIGVDTVDISAPSPGSSALILRAPDGTNVWMAELDGDTGNTDGLDVRQVGSVSVGTASNFAEGDSPSYQLQVPCGFVLLNDALGQPLFRPELIDLLEGMSLDTRATIDLSLPSGWSVLAVGDSVNTFTAQFQVPRANETVAVQLSQSPGGSLAQLTFGGRQLAPTTFLGDRAFVDSAPLFAETTSVFWRDANTVFNVRSDDLAINELESFVASLEAVEVADWEARFEQPSPAAPVLESECDPQPGFGTTLDP